MKKPYNIQSLPPAHSNREVLSGKKREITSYLPRRELLLCTLLIHWVGPGLENATFFSSWTMATAACLFKPKRKKSQRYWGRKKRNSALIVSSPSFRGYKRTMSWYPVNALRLQHLPSPASTASGVGNVCCWLHICRGQP